MRKPVLGILGMVKSVTQTLLYRFAVNQTRSFSFIMSTPTLSTLSRHHYYLAFVVLNHRSLLQGVQAYL
jgi:transcription elongation factor GreA-like protein